MLASRVRRPGERASNNMESCLPEGSGYVFPGSLPSEGHFYHTEEAILEDQPGDPRPLQYPAGSRLLPQLHRVSTAAPGQGHAL